MSITLDRVKQRAEADAKMHGYYLISDPKFLQDLLEGLKTNEERYGYPSCPCRPASGLFEQDRDIICPCDYRDIDVAEFGACYCCLYVNKAMYDSGKPTPIPERRPAGKMFPDLAMKPAEEKKTSSSTPQTMGNKLWYCKQCGYVIYREEPPYLCPICRAKKEFFEPIPLDNQQKKS